MSTIKVKWSALGNPTEPGTYRVSGVGQVEVEQEDINDAAEVGGDPFVELLDATTFGSTMKTFAVGHFIPNDDAPEVA
jgi:hypothetical protein